MWANKDRYRVKDEGVNKAFEGCFGVGASVKGVYNLPAILEKQERWRNVAEPLHFYHGDHLGSAAYLTDRDGHVVQTLAYLPYGEDWVEQNSLTDTTRLGMYRYNGKEKDYESGFHYYGARYYCSELWNGWLSVDPMADKYPGVSPYAYCVWNPVMFVDPKGDTLDIIGGEMAQTDILSIIDPIHRERVSFQNNHVLINTEGLSMDDIDRDAGLSTIYNMVNSSYKYLYSVSETNLYGDKVTIENNSITPHLDYLKKSDNLPDGYQGHIIVNPTLKEIPYEGSSPINNRPSTVFHELEENYQRTDKKHPYIYTSAKYNGNNDKKGAHQIAIEKAIRLTPSAKSKTGREGITYKLIID